jgi:GMP synthase-like glutamine amidotransferase
VTNSISNEQLVPVEPILPAAKTDKPLPKRRIGEIRVMIVNNLIHEADDFSAVARAEPNFDERSWVKRDRYISGLALANIEHNVRNLAESPDVLTVHLSEVTRESVAAFDPDAIVLSGTLRDFDYYNPEMIERFGAFVRETDVPVLGICGGHQLVGLGFGVEVVTLDRKQQAERRHDRLVEYQYRYVKIIKDDPIFDRIDDHAGESISTHRVGRHGILRVWQNHGLMIDREPEGFVRLASGYLCPIQMMVRRDERQLIYTVQFHIEKSFEDFNRPKAFWDHHVESRDGRIIFENFLVEALKHRKALERLDTCSR